mgnify:CR=1 FL=1
MPDVHGGIARGLEEGGRGGDLPGGDGREVFRRSAAHLLVGVPEQPPQHGLHRGLPRSGLRAAKQDDGAAAHRFAGISAGNLGQRTRQGVRKRRSEPAPAEEGLKPVLVFHPQRREEHRPSGLVAQGEERPEGLPLHVRVFVAEGLA